LPQEKQIVFPPFRLDPANEQLWIGLETIPLAPKAYAVLHFLATHPGRLVTKDELLDAVWPETHVTEGVLKVSVAEIRKALNDVSRSPRYIETAHRRGYRFIAQIGDAEPGVASTGIRAVERERPLEQLEAWMRKAFNGERQVVFVTGETGIGKTTLVEAFVELASADSSVWIAGGQCLEHFAEGEAYFPVLEAFTRLCAQPGRERLIEILRQQAPTWLAQMPSLVEESDRERLKRETLGAAKERMLREMAAAIEALTAETPLLLVLEDLHWSDYSTVDLISHLARRRGPARLLVIGTFRPAELIVKRHPLREIERELQAHRRCSELPLEFLTETAVAKYLALRFQGSEFPDALPRLIHERTDGNPLFLVNVVDDLIAQKQLVPGAHGWRLSVPLEEAGMTMPGSLQQLIERQIDRLSEEERRLLSVASIAGLEFSTRTLSGGMDAGVGEIETWCEGLVKRRQFLRPAKMIQLSDGSLLERYGFIHALYQHVLYHAVPQPRRVVLHRRIGEFQETAYSDHLEEIAAELAIHFHEGRDYARAIRYRRLSAVKALKQYANREAQEHLGKALALLSHLAEEEGAEMEAVLLQERGAARRAMDDNEGAAADFERAVACARQAKRTEWEVEALLKLSAVLFWMVPDRSLEVAERAVELTQGLENPVLEKHARGYCASRRIRLQGWRADDFQACVDATETARDANHAGFLGLGLMHLSFFETFRSHERDACLAADQGMQIALETGDSFLYISCQYFKAWALLHLGQWGEALNLVKDSLVLSERNGHGTATTLLRVIQARLHAQALDFAGARQICQQTLVRAREGTPRFLTLIMLGESHLGLGELDVAEECFEEVVQRSEAGPFRLDWIFHLPLYHGRTELWLRRGDYDRARQEGLYLCELAAKSGQRTYFALAWRQLAAVALAENDPVQARAELQLSLEALEGGETPLAEWRVVSTAAELSQRLGRLEEAAGYRARSMACIRGLAGSLAEHDFLRRSLLESFDRAAFAGDA
jgi:DNA-binding winged helix-turn-helix (wHTH) protein/tetratricopeptide (TPR) repeat protein/energy-coupling factor transporter ATP-binding protein EcfA2